MPEIEIQCLRLEIGAENYARRDGELITVKVKSIAIWLEPAMFFIRLLPMRLRPKSATWCMQRGIEFEEIC